MSISKFRTRDLANLTVAFSLSWQRENRLSRGMGLEHLRELLVRLARQILREGANLAYAGHWRESEDNFTYDFLRLVSAEKEDSTSGPPASNLQIGMFYNHSAWPHYLEITPRIEAQWMNCCRIVRITQQQAGIADADVVRDADAGKKRPRVSFNAAVTLSAMRRFMMEPLSIPVPDSPAPELIPPVVARILLGGKVDGYSGFMPGIFEEALLTMQKRRPTYILGGFGGAAELLANAILDKSGRPAQFTLDWHREHNKLLAGILENLHEFTLPANLSSPETSLDALFGFIERARSDLCGTLQCGLDEDETRELLLSCDVSSVVHLVCKGLMNQKKALAQTLSKPSSSTTNPP